MTQKRLLAIASELLFFKPENRVLGQLKFFWLPAVIGNWPNAWWLFLVKSGCGSVILSSKLPFACLIALHEEYFRCKKS